MSLFIRLCGICTWETPPHATYDHAHTELWDHYTTRHPYQPAHTGKPRRKP